MAATFTVKGSRVLLLLSLGLVLTFETPGAGGVGVSNLINPLFRSGSSLPKIVPPKSKSKPRGRGLLDLAASLQPSPSIPLLPNATLDLDLAGKVDVIAVLQPACWGGIDVLGLANVNIDCITNRGCADVILIIWKLLMIFQQWLKDNCHSGNKLLCLSSHLKKDIVPIDTEEKKVCGLLNRDLGPTICANCVWDYSRESNDMDAIFKVKGRGGCGSGNPPTYTLFYIACYIKEHYECLVRCLNSNGYSLLDGVDLDDLDLKTSNAKTDLSLLALNDYTTLRNKICPKCICNLITILPTGGVGGVVGGGVGR